MPERIDIHPVKKKKIELVLTSLEGQEFYMFSNNEDISPAKTVWLTEFLRHLAFGLDATTYKLFSDGMKEAIEANDTARLKQLVWLMDETALNATILETYYDIAAVLLFTLDEDTDTHDIDIAKSKKKIFKSLQPAFFLRALQKKAKFLQLTFPQDLEGYLLKNEAKIKAVLLSLSR